MAKYSEDKIARIEMAMFNPDKAKKLTPKETELKLQLEKIYAFWLDHPDLTDSMVRDMIINEFAVDLNKANRLMWYTKHLLGNVKLAKQSFHRHQVTQMLLTAYQLAQATQNITAMIQAADKLGKYHKLDKADEEEVNFDDVAVPDWEPTSDVSVLGLKPIDNLEEVKARLMKRYLSQSAEETSYTEVNE